jgi:hypothetical protein
MRWNSTGCWHSFRFLRYLMFRIGSIDTRDIPREVKSIFVFSISRDTFLRATPDSGYDICPSLVTPERDRRSTFSNGSCRDTNATLK